MRRTFYIVGAAAIVLSYAALFLLGPTAVDAFVAEDRVVESVGALALLATAVFFLLLLITGRRKGQFGTFKQIVLIGLVLLFLFGAGEEISWGQRILGLDTPEAMTAHNVQDELSIHNLSWFSGALDSGNLWRIFWIVFGVLLPVVAAVWPRARSVMERLIPVFPLWVAVFLIWNRIVAEFSEVLNANQPAWYQGMYYAFGSARWELSESVISGIFALGACALYRRMKALNPSPGKPQPTEPKP